MVCDNLNALAAYLAAEHQLPADTPWRINRSQAFSHLRRILPPVLAGSCRMTSRLVTELFCEIARNLQKFLPLRSRPRPKHAKKPHKFHAYKPAV